jgi:molecular chaperone GrpE (heat shock protein)
MATQNDLSKLSPCHCDRLSQLEQDIASIKNNLARQDDEICEIKMRTDADTQEIRLEIMKLWQRSEEYPVANWEGD